MERRMSEAYPAADRLRLRLRLIVIKRICGHRLILISDVRDGYV